MTARCPAPASATSRRPDLASLQAWGSDADAGRTLELVALHHGLVADRVPADAGFHFTGFWAPPRRPAPWPPMPGLPPAADGMAPVVTTMGSMATFDDQRLMACLAQALDLAGLPGIVVGGWSGCRAPAGSRLRHVDEADYAALFAGALCVVHHGGSGTVGAVLRAGVPSILLPQVEPQWLWAEVLDRAGLSAGSFRAETLSAAELASALRRVAGDTALQQRARRWQSKLQGDPGVAGAAALIEDHWHRMQRQPLHAPQPQGATP